MAIISSFVKCSLIIILRCYRYILSPLLGSCCRFQPSCSTYAIQAINVHGCMKGCYLAGRRLLRCHPWHAGGVDPIP